jgi:hypothetical protein
MSPGPMAPRAVLEEEGFDIFNLGADVIGLGGYLQAKMDAFAGEAVAKGKGRKTKTYG